MSASSAKIKKLAQRNVPVLCLDTCAILDILRDPTRKDVNLYNQKAYLSLLREAESGGRLTTLISNRVQTEFQNNIQHIRCQSEKILAKFRQNIEKIDELSNLHGLQGTTDLRHWEDYVERCRDAAERWIKSGTQVLDSDEIILKADQRSVKARAPARKGKQSNQDCVILETYYHYIRIFRSHGLTAPAVFLSSNVKDYAEPSGRKIRIDIEDEFTSLGLEYAPNMAAAKDFLKL